VRPSGFPNSGALNFSRPALKRISKSNSFRNAKRCSPLLKQRAPTKVLNCHPERRPDCQAGVPFDGERTTDASLVSTRNVNVSWR
jgi:hypothetical protein